jgi:thymidylate synthase ThyX
MQEHEVTILPSEYRSDPEVVAMLQAFYSRSIEGIKPRLERLGPDLGGVKKSLNQYMVNYGHASIGDCATVPIFLENVSILAAKAIQDSPLFNGQECSTRYIELSGKCYSTGAVMSKFQRDWLAMYHETLEALIEGITQKHPITDYFENPTEAESKKYQNTVKAKAFDIARAFIPAGACTNTSWNATLRKAKEHCLFLMGHPLVEVRSIAVSTLSRLASEFPHSFLSQGELLTKEDTEVSAWHVANPELYYQTDSSLTSLTDRAVLFSGKLSDTVRNLITSMPRKRTYLPQAFNHEVEVELRGTIDYGCWRELQRHRNGVCRNPLLTPHMGIHNWYYSQLEEYLPEQKMEDLRSRIAFLFLEIMDTLKYDDYGRQYALPLGTVVLFKVHYGLSEILYFSRLRSSTTVHPILRRITQFLAREFETNYGVSTMADMSEEAKGLNLKRGSQTIEKKETSNA